MPTGSPDFNANNTTNPTSPSYDSGEDTTRLLMGGGANSRAGRWLWATGFENDPLGYGPINLGTTFNGNGRNTIISLTKSPLGTDNISNQTIWQGNQCLEIRSGTLINQSIEVFKLIAWQSGVCGIEFFFCLLEDDLEQYELQLFMTRDGYLGKANFGSIVLKRSATETKLYTDNNGTRVEISDVAGHFDDGAMWHYIKMVYDMANNKYIRVYLDNLLFDLGSAPGYQITSGGFGDRFAVRFKTLAAAERIIRIDNLILTGDEP